MYTYRNPITEIGDYSSVVPFNREFFIGEEIVLSSNDTLTPLVGTPAALANKVPMPGATTIYRLVGNGVNEPSFSPEFSPMTGYGYNKAEGIVNTIIMWYDGSGFLYKILREAPQPEPPLLGKDQWVNDFGLGEGVISLVVINNSYVNVGDILATLVLGVGRKRLCIFDFITSIHYTGMAPLIYWMSKNGDPPIENEDPTLAVIDLNCLDVGVPVTITLGVYVDGGPSSQTYSYTVFLQDTNLVCAPI